MTKWLHRPMCTRYMHAPVVRKDVVPSAVHAGQSHDNVTDIVGFSWRHIPGRGYTLHRVHTTWDIGNP